mmetsp:Transcript_16269/g.50999  ORF Transcript_16269/g.50999 Transcript_16269/m.50999 type:complete len:352 (-) Transcript_16269:666-1721(-)
MAVAGVLAVCAEDLLHDSLLPLLLHHGCSWLHTDLHRPMCRGLSGSRCGHQRDAVRRQPLHLSPLEVHLRALRTTPRGHHVDCPPRLCHRDHPVLHGQVVDGPLPRAHDRRAQQPVRPLHPAMVRLRDVRGHQDRRARGVGQDARARRSVQLQRRDLRQHRGHGAHPTRDRGVEAAHGVESASDVLDLLLVLRDAGLDNTKEQRLEALEEHLPRDAVRDSDPRCSSQAQQVPGDARDEVAGDSGEQGLRHRGRRDHPRHEACAQVCRFCTRGLDHALLRLVDGRARGRLPRPRPVLWGDDLHRRPVRDPHRGDPRPHRVLVGQEVAWQPRSPNHADGRRCVSHPGLELEGA